MNTVRKSNLGMAGLVCSELLLVADSCDLSQDNVQPDPVAYVSLYQASPNAPDLSIEVDGRQLNTYPFNYADYTGYLRFYIGSRNLKFGPFGANNAVIDTTVTLENLNVYSIFLADNYEDVTLLILNDSTDDPAAGKAMIRFVNVSPDAPDVDLKVKDEASSLITGISFKESSEFIELDPNLYDFQVTTGNNGNNNVILEVPDIIVQEGFFYTILLRGYDTPPAGSTNVLSGEVIVN